MKLRKFTFVEIDLSKKCYRVTWVFGSSEADARSQMKVSSWGCGLIGVQSTTAKKRGYKTALLRTKDEFETLIDRFLLKQEDVDKLIRLSY